MKQCLGTSPFERITNKNDIKITVPSKRIEQITARERLGYTASKAHSQKSALLPTTHRIKVEKLSKQIHWFIVFFRRSA